MFFINFKFFYFFFFFFFFFFWYGRRGTKGGKTKKKKKNTSHFFWANASYLLGFIIKHCYFANKAPNVKTKRPALNFFFNLLMEDEIV